MNGWHPTAGATPSTLPMMPHACTCDAFQNPGLCDRRLAAVVVVSADGPGVDRANRIELVGRWRLGRIIVEPSLFRFAD